MNTQITKQAQQQRKAIAGQARDVVSRALPIEDADETSLTLGYEGFYLQISFSDMHPLMMFYFARALGNSGTVKIIRAVNELNQHSVLGTHVINEEIGCYVFRSVHWLDCELTKERFFEMLVRCTEEAERAYSKIQN